MAHFTGTRITRHDDNGVLEVDLAAIAIRKDTVVQNLQKQVVDVGVSLLDFVEEHHAVRALAHLFAQLSTAVLEAHVSRRRTNQAANAMLFHVFAHVDTDHGIFATKQALGKHLR